MIVPTHGKGNEIEILLDDIMYCDSPKGRIPVDVGRQAVIVGRLAVFLARHGKTLEIVKGEGKNTPKKDDLTR